MPDKVLNKYKLTFDENDYLVGFYAVLDDNYDYYGQMADFPESCEGWTKFENGEFVEDPEKKAEIIAEREREAQLPTWEEIIESQVYYTALITDTLIEEEE